MPTVCEPAIAVPNYQVTTEEILETLAVHYREHPRLADSLRVITATTVHSRRYTRPLEEILNEKAVLGDRLRRHFRDSCDLAEAAAREALDRGGAHAHEIDTLVVTSHSGHTMPGIDIELHGRLGLPPDTRRIPVTQLACGGGAWAIARAAEAVGDRPRGRALVICADVASVALHPDDTGMDGMIFKGLLGDAAGACVVRGDSACPGLIVHQSWEYIVPGTADIVGSMIEDDGLHAHNHVRLMEAVNVALLELAGWLRRNSPDRSPTPEFVISHPGGPKVLEGVVNGLGLEVAAVRHSWASLQELGNTGSPSVLDVLRRTFHAPPPSGSRGVLLGVGPGVSMVASRVEWR